MLWFLKENQTLLKYLFLKEMLRYFLIFMF
jgi:hypothetical protein